MIADSGLLASSPWQSESLMKEAGDFLRNVSLDMSLQGMDLDLATLESEIERVRQQHNNLNELIPESLEFDSRGASVASSECSDEPYLDIENNFEELLFSSNSSDQEYLSSSLHSLLELGDVPSTFEWSDSGLPRIANTEEECDVDQSSTNSAQQKSSTSDNSSQQHCMSKQWSERSPEEQIEVVEELSRVISNELGLREQLEVIRLINPSADVSPTDREFVIDLESITEKKLKQIQKFIKDHVESLNSPDVIQDNSPQKKNTKKNAKDRKSQHKALRQRQRKEYRQMMKEKRSGLFVKEEVLALSICEPIEEAEVDILA